MPIASDGSVIISGDTADRGKALIARCSGPSFVPVPTNCLETTTSCVSCRWICFNWSKYTPYTSNPDSKAADILIAICLRLFIPSPAFFRETKKTQTLEVSLRRLRSSQIVMHYGFTRLTITND